MEASTGLSEDDGAQTILSAGWLKGVMEVKEANDPSNYHDGPIRTAGDGGAEPYTAAPPLGLNSHLVSDLVTL